MKAAVRRSVGARRGVLETHLPLFLTKDGDLWRDSAVGREMAVYLTRIVMVGSRRAVGKRPGKVLCASHAVPGGCPGVIQTSIEKKPDRMEWRCPACGYDGSITGWEGTRWDRSKMVRRTAPERKRAGAAATKSAGSKLARKKASQVA